MMKSELEKIIYNFADDILITAQLDNKLKLFLLLGPDIEFHVSQLQNRIFTYLDSNMKDLDSNIKECQNDE